MKAPPKFKKGDEVYVIARGVAIMSSVILEVDPKGTDGYFIDWGIWYPSAALELREIYNSPLYKALT